MRNRIYILFILISGISSAQLNDRRNHPELHWRKVETTHFRIICHQGLDSLAREASRIAEELYGPITQDLGVEPRGKTVIILSDVDDLSNGRASPLDHTIFIWTKSAKKETTGSIGWLRRVIGHEFAHMVTFWGCRNFLGKPWELLTLGLTPTWFLEGVAQYEAESWDDHRDLLLRIAVRDSALLPPRKLDGFVGADIVESRLVYEEGHGLVRYLASEYGQEKVRELIQRHRKFPLSFTWTMKRTLGKTTGSIYREWKDEVQKEYSRFFEGRESGESIGERIRIPIQVVTGLRWSAVGEKVAIVGMERWDEGIQRLYVAGKDGSFLRSIGRSHVGSYFSWSPDGERLVISRKRRGRHGSFVEDLFIVNSTNGKERRITEDVRGSDPTWSPQGDEICFVRRCTGGSNLWLFDIGSRKIVELMDVRPGVEIFSPCWSPDGERIVFSILDEGGSRDIAVVDREGSGFHRLTDDSIDDRTPAWSPDGEWIAFCSYRGGVPNLYLIRPDGSQRIQVTDVAGGVFNPTWTPDGQGITGVFFEERDSVTVYTIPMFRKIERKQVETRPRWASLEPFDKGEIFCKKEKSMGFNSSPYRSWASVKPLITFPFVGRDDGGLQAGLIHYASDPLGKHEILGYITGRRRVDWWIDYVNRQWEPVINFSFWGSTEDRGNLFGLDRYPLWERRTGAGLHFSFPMNFGRTLLSNHIITLYGNAERVGILYSERFLDIRPEFRPFTGWINSIGLGYGWRWERPDVGRGIHPSTGFSLFSSFLRSDRLLGSDLERSRLTSDVSLRQELPWGRHVFGLSVGTLLQWGEQPIQDRMSLDSPVFVRGLDRSREGDRFLYGSLEYRIPLIRDLGFRIPIFYFERFAWAFWADWGKAWGRNLQTYRTGVRRSFGEADWVMTAGGELRCRIYLWGKLPVVVRGGYGQEVTAGKEGGWYWLIGSVF